MSKVPPIKLRETEIYIHPVELLPEQSVKQMTAVLTNTSADEQEINNNLCACELACECVRTRKGSYNSVNGTLVRARACMCTYMNCVCVI
jgi:hypothetical protein